MRQARTPLALARGWLHAPPMAYTEERVFSLRLELRCEFPDDYEGEQDGYAWASGIPDIVHDVVQATMRAIGTRPGWIANSAVTATVARSRWPP